MVLVVIVQCIAVQYNPNPTSEMSADDKNTTNKTIEQSEESGHEIEIDDDVKEKKFLEDAMKTIIDPTTTLVAKTNIILQAFKYKLDELDNVSISFDVFMDEMDKLSLDICKNSQDALWSYVTDINNDIKKNTMVNMIKDYVYIYVLHIKVFLSQ